MTKGELPEDIQGYTKGKWYAVEDKLPPEPNDESKYSDMMLLHNEDGYSVGFYGYNDGCWWSEHNNGDEIYPKHWQYLPQFMKQGELPEDIQGEIENFIRNYSLGISTLTQILESSYHLRDEEVNNLRIHNSMLNDENDGFRKLVDEQQQTINELQDQVEKISDLAEYNGRRMVERDQTIKELQAEIERLKELRKAASFGYHLRYEEVEELKEVCEKQLETIKELQAFIEKAFREGMIEGNEPVLTYDEAWEQFKKENNL
jgi:hypothetical protein